MYEDSKRNEFFDISAEREQIDILRGFNQIAETLKYDALLEREKRIPYISNKIGSALYKGFSSCEEYIVISTNKEDEFLKDVYEKCGKKMGNLFLSLFTIANNRMFLSCDLCKHSLNNSCPKKKDREFSACLEIDPLVLKENVSWCQALMGKGKGTLYVDAKAIEKILEEEKDKENSFILTNVKRAIALMEKTYEYGVPIENNLLDEIIAEKIELLKAVKKNEQETKDNGDIG